MRHRWLFPEARCRHGGGCCGPDGSGRFSDAHAGIVHTRLSIVDLANGAQPFLAPPEDGGKVLAANGEIYNHAALRASH